MHSRIFFCFLTQDIICPFHLIGTMNADHLFISHFLKALFDPSHLHFLWWCGNQLLVCRVQSGVKTVLSWVLCSGRDEYANRFLHRWKVQQHGPAGIVMTVMKWWPFNQIVHWAKDFLFCLLWPIPIRSWSPLSTGYLFSSQLYKSLIRRSLIDI